MTYSGSCNCGKVQFKGLNKLEDVYICHCSTCRKSTGSSGIAVAISKVEDFIWVSGLEFVKTWKKPNHDWETSFCTTCGAPLPGTNDESTYYVPVSLLDSGGEHLSVKHHIFVNSKASWSEIGDTGKQHPEHIGSGNK